MNGISTTELSHCDHLKKLIVHSLEHMDYQVSVEHNGLELMLVDEQGEPVRFHNTQEIRDLVHNIRIEKAVMQMTATYDEMIGQPRVFNERPAEMKLGW